MKHISVCVCTYKRPHLLASLLQGLRVQDTSELFTYSIVVVDNDCLRSAEAVVSDFRSTSHVPVTYCVEAQQNIALARNKAITNAKGDLVAFIDDDEIPTSNWLLTLFEAYRKYGVNGVLGSVKPQFEDNAPQWVIRGKFYERPTYPTGLIIDGRKGRTGNVLFEGNICATDEQPFRPEFVTGEDQDFFRRMIARGHVFIWCNEAVAYEIVPPNRWKRTFMLRRALLRGATAVIHPTFQASDILRSVIAVPAYAVALPFSLLLGQYKFMALLVKLFDHLGKLFSLLGINLVRTQYVTD